MPQPTPYDRQNSFTLIAQENPAEPYTGTQLDVEFNALKVTLDELLANIVLIQRDDGELANATVGPDQLAAALEIGINPPTLWVTATAYTKFNTVFVDALMYRALEAHTSGADFATDLAAGKWELIADFLGDFDPLVLNDGDVTTAKLADAAVTTQKIALDAVAATRLAVNAVTASKIADGAVTGGKIAAGAVASGNLATNAVTAEKIVDEAVGTAKIADGAVTSDKLAPGLGLDFPVGFVADFAGATAPPRWLLCYGQEISRTTYSGLFDVIGTTYGSTSGTTFKVPDLRGRVLAGKDNMGGTSADRLTDQSGGLNGDTLGAAGGTETHALTEAQLASHVHRAGIAHDIDGSSDRVGINGSESVGKGNAIRVHNGGFGTAPATVSDYLTNSAGSGTGHNNVQPTIVLNKMIYTGVA